MKSLVIAAAVLAGTSTSLFALSTPAAAHAQAACSKHRVATVTKSLGGRRVSLWQCGSSGKFYATIGGGRSGDVVWVRNRTTSATAKSKVASGHTTTKTGTLTLGNGQSVWACGDPVGSRPSVCTRAVRYTQPGGPDPTIP